MTRNLVFHAAWKGHIDLELYPAPNAELGTVLHASYSSKFHNFRSWSSVRWLLGCSENEARGFLSETVRWLNSLCDVRYERPKADDSSFNSDNILYGLCAASIVGDVESARRFLPMIEDRRTDYIGTGRYGIFTRHAQRTHYAIRELCFGNTDAVHELVGRFTPETPEKVILALARMCVAIADRKSGAVHEWANELEQACIDKVRNVRIMTDISLDDAWSLPGVFLLRLALARGIITPEDVPAGDFVPRELVFLTPPFDF